MSRQAIRLIAGIVVLSFAALTACDGDGYSDDRQAAEGTVQDAATAVRREAREAWATLRTDGERLIDRVQARNDPEAKQDLLDRCRDAEERLRKMGDSNAGRVNELCDRIRDADVNSRSTWDEIERRFDELNSQMRS